MTNEEAHKYLHDLENVRERHWRDTEQGAFEAAMASRDGFPNPPDASDGGAGVRRMVREIDRQELAQIRGVSPNRQQCILNASKTISRKAPECLATFWAVVRNGTNRKESIWELMHEWAENPPVKRATKRRQKRRRPKRRGKRQGTSIIPTLKKC